jgi:hypothetical protein
MYKRLRGFPPLLIFFLASSFIVGQSKVLASTDLKGGVEKRAASASAGALSGSADSWGSSNFLQGGVNQIAPLHPSLKVIPGTYDSAGKPLSGGAHKSMFPLGADLIQYQGGVQVAPPPEQLYPGSPSSARRIGGSIPPVSSYQIIPRTGVMNFDPSLETSTFTSVKGVTTYVPGYQAARAPAAQSSISSYTPGYDSASASVTTHKGITSYDSAYEAPVVGASGDLGTPASHKGITVFDPGLEVSTTAVMTASQTPSSTIGGLTSWVPGTEIYKAPSAEVSISQTRSGVTCWAPGYEVSVSTPGLIKNTLGGSWSSTVNEPVGLRATEKSLVPNKIFTQAVVAPPLEAKALLLPELRVTAESLTWDDWYKRMAKAIYSGWQAAEVGPGVATVRVTVTKSRNLSCEVVDFTPAADVSRDVATETAFREAAVKSVNLVNKFEIPEFPSLGDKQEVTFDVQMKRTVSGPLGPVVVPARTASK